VIALSLQAQCDFATSADAVAAITAAHKSIPVTYTVPAGVGNDGAATPSSTGPLQFGFSAENGTSAGELPIQFGDVDAAVPLSATGAGGNIATEPFGPEPETVSAETLSGCAELQGAVWWALAAAAALSVGYAAF
jgi:hypothetical protein